jgi:hypothetical protein
MCIIYGILITILQGMTAISLNFYWYNIHLYNQLDQSYNLSVFFWYHTFHD